jgi:hypothetical protein
MNSDKMIIGLKGRDAVRELLAKKSLGDRCTIEVEVTIDEITPDQAVFSIVDAEVEDASAPETPESESEENPMPMEGMMEKKSKGPPAVMVAFGGKKS